MRLNKMVRTDCAICGSENNELLWKKTRPTGLLDKIYLSICRDCGFVFQNPRLSLEATRKYYLQEFDQQNRKGIFSNQLSDSGKTKKKLMFDRIKPFLCHNGELNCLDIGAGTGYFLKIFREDLQERSKLRLFAIEPSCHCQKLLEKAGIYILSDDVDSDWKEAGTKYDVIVMRHVLEHFYDPFASLKNISKCLKKDGFIYLAVPNLLHLKPRFYGHITLAHLSYFSVPILKNLISRCDLTAISLNNDTKEIWCILKPALQQEVLPVSAKNAFIENKQFVRSRQRNELLLRLKERAKNYIKYALSFVKKVR